MFGSFDPETLERYAQLAAEKAGVDFAEDDTYDFTRCVRSDGSVYGTRGKCRKGTETGAKEEGTGEGKKVSKKQAEKVFGTLFKKLRKEMEYEGDVEYTDDEWNDTYSQGVRKKKGKYEMVVTVSNDEGGGQYVVARMNEKDGKVDYLGLANLEEI